MDDTKTTDEQVLSEPDTTPKGVTRSRRELLFGLAAAAPVVASMVGAKAATPAAHPDAELIYRGISRGTFGWTLQEQQYAESIGYEAWLAEQLDPDSILEPAFDQFIVANYPTHDDSPQKISDDGNGNRAQAEYISLRTYRAVYSRKQLFERIVDFWTNHFNIDVRKGKGRFFIGKFQQEVIREHALGTFEDLLLEVAKSAAMSEYLDNHANEAGAIQENYARELMELHTLGVDGPYDENDVREVARALTGWKYHGTNNGRFGDFLYNDAVHDQGSKTVLNQTLTQTGVREGVEVLEILRNDPACAEFLATEMCKYFVSENPDQSLVNQIAAVYTTTGGDLKAMFARLFSRAVFENTDFSVHRKLRQPHQYVCGLLRVCQAVLVNPHLRAVGPWLDTLGQVPYQWPAPNGYPDARAYWGTALFPYMQFANELLYTEFDPAEVTVDFNALFAPLGGLDRSNYVRQVNKLLTNDHLSIIDLQQAQQVYTSFPGPTFPVKLEQEIFIMLASAPSFLHY